VKASPHDRAFREEPGSERKPYARITSELWEQYLCIVSTASSGYPGQPRERARGSPVYRGSAQDSACIDTACIDTPGNRRWHAGAAFLKGGPFRKPNNGCKCEGAPPPNRFGSRLRACTIPSVWHGTRSSAWGARASRAKNCRPRPCSRGPCSRGPCFRGLPPLAPDPLALDSSAATSATREPEPPQLAFRNRADARPSLPGHSVHAPQGWCQGIGTRVRRPPIA
jgi:hypothetical protein